MKGNVKTCAAILLASTLTFAGSTAVWGEADELGQIAAEKGIWEESFERANENLNGLAVRDKDEAYAAYKEPCEEKGTVEAFEYETRFYAYGSAEGIDDSELEPISKTAYVYTPYGYDENQQYNILYLLHGGGDDAAAWFSMGNELGERFELGEGTACNILDNLIAKGDIEPCIVVTPGIYDVPEELTAEMPAQIGFAWTENFAKELEDLIPAVEGKYSTYAEDVTEEALISSRDHRAMAGLSMGSITTWHSGIAQMIDKISWFGNMSGGPSSDIDEAKDYIENKIIPALEDAKENGYEMNMMLSMNGHKDIALDPHVETHKLLVNYAETSDYLQVGENYDFLFVHGYHTWPTWQLYLYDMMQVFFK